MKLKPAPAMRLSCKEIAKISTQEFAQLRDCLFEKSGIYLADHKSSLVETRLAKRIRELEVSSYSEYIAHLFATPEEMGVFINLMTTNKTEFFRENQHFDFLVETVLPEILSHKSKPELNVWSAASSTGEEVYTLAMVLNEYRAKHHPSLVTRLLGTDIDTAVLKTCEAGVYRASVVEEQIPRELIRKYFLRGTGSNEGFYRFDPSFKQAIKFRPFNLIEGDFSSPIQFDVIFLRNVLIYFKEETIKQVIDRLSSRLAPGGYFFIAHSETLNGIRHSLKAVKGSVFKKPR